jgi:hypothetical protein
VPTSIHPLSFAAWLPPSGTISRCCSSRARASSGPDPPRFPPPRAKTPGTLGDASARIYLGFCGFWSGRNGRERASLTFTPLKS